MSGAAKPWAECRCDAIRVSRVVGGCDAAGRVEDGVQEDSAREERVESLLSRSELQPRVHAGSGWGGCRRGSKTLIAGCTTTRRQGVEGGWADGGLAEMIWWV